jgi:hypothetical protein
VKNSGSGDQTIDGGHMAAALLGRRAHAAPHGCHGGVNRQDAGGVGGGEGSEPGAQRGPPATRLQERNALLDPLGQQVEAIGLDDLIRKKTLASFVTI